MIKTLIFDFGDVFINLNKKATLDCLKTLGISTPTKEMHHLAIDYEQGLITTPQFISALKQLIPDVSNEDIIQAWNAIILDFPEHRLEFLERLNKERAFQLILLSNTNELHIEKVIYNMGLERYLRFKSCFDCFYLSHEIKRRKPNASIYDFVLEENQLLPEQCFFIDDTKVNTDTAKELGIVTWTIEPGHNDVTDLFNLHPTVFH
jgi:putative hydrolase of the HAD superfamily